MVTEFLVETILTSESDDGRFELFANEIVSTIENRPILPTSRSWDLKRDGRARTEAGTIYVCNSIDPDPAGKFTRDVTGLIANADDVAILYLCSNQTISEHKCEHTYRPALQPLLPPSAVLQCLGRR
jgi:hypothetical protein